MTNEKNRPLPPDPIVCSAEFSGDGCIEPPEDDADLTEQTEAHTEA
jgi:hypothetical protein